MKSLSKKTRYLIIFGSLLLLMLFTGFGLSSYRVPAQAESSPTPTSLTVNGEPHLQSGDTDGLILGAGIILFIILSGVVIQRTLMKSEGDQPREPID